MIEKKNIEELFQKEFETFEVQPSKKVWRRVRSELFFKNFIRFSPDKFNVWYAGGILIISSILLLNLSKTEKQSILNPVAENSFSLNTDSLSAQDKLKDITENQVKEENSNPISNLKTEIRNHGFNKTKNNTGKSRIQNPGFKNELSTSDAQNEKSQSQLKSTGINYSGQSIIAWFECLTPEGCTPLSSSFRNFSQNAVRYLWSFGDGGSSELENPSYIFDEPGTWFVSLTAFSASGEISIFTDSIRVNPLPQARFTMDLQGMPGDGQPVYFYNHSHGAESFFWDFGDGGTSTLKEPDHYFNKKSKTDIKLLVCSNAGCRDSSILIDAFKNVEPAFIFPTAFSPNTNGPGTGQYSRKDPANDVFYPFVEEDPEEYQLKIFNRNGILLFESNDIGLGWDGYYHEQLLPQGVYVWKARAKFADGRSVVKMGDVTLLWGK